MIYFGMALAAYLAAGLLFTLACAPRFARDARIIRARGGRPLVARSAALAFWCWPYYLLSRGDNARWQPGTRRTIWVYRRPNQDRIDDLERELRE